MQHLDMTDSNLAFIMFYNTMCKDRNSIILNGISLSNENICINVWIQLYEQQVALTF